MNIKLMNVMAMGNMLLILVLTREIGSSSRMRIDLIANEVSTLTESDCTALTKVGRTILKIASVCAPEVW